MLNHSVYEDMKKLESAQIMPTKEEKVELYVGWPCKYTSQILNQDFHHITQVIMLYNEGFVDLEFYRLAIIKPRYKIKPIVNFLFYYYLYNFSIKFYRQPIYMMHVLESACVSKG